MGRTHRECVTHHAACPCGEAAHDAEVAALRAELTAERAVSASLREQLASLSGKVLGAATDYRADREPVVISWEPLRPNAALMREIVQDLRDGGLLSAAPEKPSRVECPTCHGDDPCDGPQAHQSCGTCGGAGTVPATQGHPYRTPTPPAPRSPKPRPAPADPNIPPKEVCR